MDREREQEADPPVIRRHGPRATGRGPRAAGHGPRATDRGPRTAGHGPWAAGHASEAARSRAWLLVGWAVHRPPPRTPLPEARSARPLPSLAPPERPPPLSRRPKGGGSKLTTSPRSKGLSSPSPPEPPPEPRHLRFEFEEEALRRIAHGLVTHEARIEDGDWKGISVRGPRRPRHPRRPCRPRVPPQPLPAPPASSRPLQPPPPATSPAAPPPWPR